MKNKKKKCPKGHEFTKENICITKLGCNQCKKCKRDRTRIFYKLNKEECLKYARNYSKSYTISGKSIIASTKWIKNNPEKRKAHIILRNAIKNNVLNRLPCEICGNSRTDGHHQDYSKPLEVMWLCRIHHKEHHAKERLLNKSISREQCEK